MADSLLILGRQPALGLAELESRYASVQPVGEHAALIAAEVDFKRLGGSVKAGKVLATFGATNWKNIETHLLKHIADYVAALPEGKLQLGLSVYGLRESAQRIIATGLSLKKTLKKASKSVRLTPNQEPALSSAQVAHNHLTGPTGCELLIASDGHQTVLAQTFAVQDINSYTLRDRGRPKRDARVGMLPPKLAQIIINLAAQDQRELTVLDPFCGTGVVLQEALLMGYSVYGSDLEPRMIDYSGENLDWLDGHFDLSKTTMRLEQADATSWRWQPPIDAVACETYLGRPFTTTPQTAMLTQTVSDCNLIIKKFLTNIHAQLKPNTRLCLAVPAWQVHKNEFKHLPVIDQISNLGYNRVKFEHVLGTQLLYYREDQIVARQLLVLTRK